jgi:hypothetical protein
MIIVHCMIIHRNLYLPYKGRHHEVHYSDFGMHGDVPGDARPIQ